LSAHCNFATTKPFLGALDSPHPSDRTQLRTFEFTVWLSKNTKTEELTGYWRKLHNEELRALDCLPDFFVIETKRMRWAANVARLVEKCILSFVGKPEGQRLLGRAMRKWLWIILKWILKR
jgi:hypothetical protein